MTEQDNFFVVKSEDGLIALGKWLANKEYNYYNKKLKDKNNDKLIGLFFNKDEDYQKRGLILIKNIDLLDAAVNIIAENKLEKEVA